MEKYNYLEAIYDTILECIDDYTYIIEECFDADYFELDTNALFDSLYDEMIIDDSITGNGSGSYTFNTYTAEEYLCHNWQLLEEALITFGYDNSINVLEKGAEWCDVIIRCYLLPEALQKVIDNYTDEWENTLTTSSSE